MHETVSDRRESIAKLTELIRGINSAMLTTQNSEGQLVSRPMVTQQKDFDGVIWFFTDSTSPKATELLQNPMVNVAYADLPHGVFVSVSGKAKLVYDKAKAEELWDPAYQVFFPKGLEDPSLCLVKVDVLSAEYWDSPRFLKGPGENKILRVG